MAIFKKVLVKLLKKVLVKLFQKLARVEGAKPSSRSAERETPMAFLFVSFFFAPLAAKEKAESAWG